MAQGRNPKDVSAANTGYDIRSIKPNGSLRYIEVKARAGDGKVALTPNAWITTQKLGESHWLYVVANAATNTDSSKTQSNGAPHTLGAGVPT